MLDFVIVLCAALLLIVLLYGQHALKSRLSLISKACASILFIALALVQPHPVPSYYYLMLAGLFLGMVGDVCLALPSPKAFTAGLVSFLLGHVLYVAAFFLFAAPADFVTPLTAAFALYCVGAFLWLRPHLGEMLVPVTVYICVIGIMMSAAGAVFWGGNIPQTGARLVLAGAVCFGVSDLFVAKRRFVADTPVTYFVGLPLYYAGQFALAFSVGLVS
jgi:uncharacterized membrane protein YhhN